MYVLIKEVREIACSKPLTAFVKTDLQTGKKVLSFVKAKDGRILDEYIQRKEVMLIPCGQCAECRAQYARNWANRLLLELQYHDSAYFVTLTYDDAHVPRSVSKDGVPHLTLDKRDCQLFFKRLRKAFPDDHIRYFLAGEYGDQTHRPHYHVIVFGLHLNDLVLVGRNEFNQPYFDSVSLTNVWQKGSITAAAVSWESCCYVARYCMKKLKGDMRFFYQDVNIVPPFVLMSRKPGLGYQWFLDHPDFTDHSKINIATATGRRSFRPPRYFEKKLEEIDPDLAKKRAADRELYSLINYENTKLNTSLDYFQQVQVESDAKRCDSVRKF